MTDKLHPMLEATRLTRGGRLIEATELLQHLLRGEAPGPASGAFGGTVNAPGAGASPINEAAPGTAEAGPQPSGRRTGTRRRSTGGAEGAARPHWPDEIRRFIKQINRPGSASVQPHLPEALRSFLERVNRIGPETAIPGLLGRSPAHAPEPVPEGAHFVERFYSNQAGSRAYKLYIPSGYRDQALPLVVMLHGCTQTPDDFAAGTRMNALAEERTCFVAYPAQAASANPSKCWNWFTPGNQQRGAGEPSLIAGMTRQIMRDYSVDPQRVYVAGLSAGGAAAAVMGMTYPDLYAAIGVHSGLACGAASDLLSAFAAMRQGEPVASGVLSSPALGTDSDLLSMLNAVLPGKPAALGAASSLALGADSDLLSMFKAMRPGKPAAFEAPSSSAGDARRQRAVPTIVFHGDQDTRVHARNGDLVIEQSRTTAAMDLHTRVEHGQAPGGHAYSRTLHADASGQAILEQWVIHGAGHAWSGGSPAGSFTDPRGPDAGREMLRFFLEHSHPAPGANGDATHDAPAAQGKPARKRRNLKRS
jgi:poly(hydroxyalkanoate) depolymerase family esterase